MRALLLINFKLISRDWGIYYTQLDASSHSISLISSYTVSVVFSIEEHVILYSAKSNIKDRTGAMHYIRHVLAVKNTPLAGPAVSYSINMHRKSKCSLLEFYIDPTNRPCFISIPWGHYCFCLWYCKINHYLLYLLNRYWWIFWILKSGWGFGSFWGFLMLREM